MTKRAPSKPKPVKAWAIADQKRGKFITWAGDGPAIWAHRKDAVFNLCDDEEPVRVEIRVVK